MRSVEKILIAVLIVCIAIAGVGGYYFGLYYADKNAQQIKSALQAQITTKDAIIKSLTAQKTNELTQTGSDQKTTSGSNNVSGWQSYNNGTYGFELNYPASWPKAEEEKNGPHNLSEDFSSSGITTTSIYSSQLVNAFVTLDPNGLGGVSAPADVTDDKTSVLANVTLYVFDNPNSYNVSDFYGHVYKDLGNDVLGQIYAGINKRTILDVNGLTGYVVPRHLIASDGTASVQYVDFVRGDKFYRVSMRTDSSKQDLDEKLTSLFTEIVKTIKFTK